MANLNEKRDRSQLSGLEVIYDEKPKRRTSDNGITFEQTQIEILRDFVQELTAIAASPDHEQYQLVTLLMDTSAEWLTATQNYRLETAKINIPTNVCLATILIFLAEKLTNLPILATLPDALWGTTAIIEALLLVSSGLIASFRRLNEFVGVTELDSKPASTALHNAEAELSKLNQSLEDLANLFSREFNFKVKATQLRRIGIYLLRDHIETEKLQSEKEAAKHALEESIERAQKRLKS